MEPPAVNISVNLALIKPPKTNSPPCFAKTSNFWINNPIAINNFCPNGTLNINTAKQYLQKKPHTYCFIVNSLPVI